MDKDASSTTTRRDREQSGSVSREANRQRNRNIQYQGTGQTQSLLRRAAEDMDQLMNLVGFGSSFSDFGLPRVASQSLQEVWTPQIDVHRKNGNLVVRADLPGVKPDDVTVEVDDGVLTITGERNDVTEEDREGYYRSERSYGQFYRAIPLPENVDENEIEARFDNGVLEVTVPAPEKQTRQAKRVRVNSGKKQG